MKKMLTLILALLMVASLATTAAAELVPSELFMTLPEDLICTPDSMTIDGEGNLIMSCPNFADLSMPSIIVKIDADKNLTKWFDVPLNEESGEARAMGIAFGPDGDLYIVDNAGWTGLEHMVNTGRVLRVRMNGDEIEKVTVVAHGMEHPNGIRIRGNNMYVTQSSMVQVPGPGGKLVSAVYRFDLDDEDIAITNTMADENILATFVTYNPDCQYGLDGIEFAPNGDLIVGDFGDGSLHRMILSDDGLSVLREETFAVDNDELITTDGITIDENGNFYVADFSGNAIAKVTPEGVVTRYAYSDDSDGLNGELDQPGEPCVWNGQLIVTCFDLVVDSQKVNTAHEMPATMAVLEIK